MSKGPRERLLLPLLIPVIALAIIGTVLFVFSRILLDVSHQAATAVALLVSAAIMAIAGYVSTRDKITGASLWSMSGAILGVGMLIGGVALLVGQPHDEEVVEPFIAVITAPEGAATSGFEPTALTGPADEPFIVELRNDDTAQHNFTVFDAEGGTELAVGPDIGGPGLVANTNVPALPEGEYFFECTLHATTMTGTLTVQPGGGPVVVAAGLEFDTAEIVLPPDTASPLTLDNQDAGTVHNISIFTDESATDVLFDGPDFPGIASQTYEVPPLAAGTYYFHCDTHPVMAGTVVVGPPEGAPGGEPPPDEESPPPEQ